MMTMTGVDDGSDVDADNNDGSGVDNDDADIFGAVQW